MSELRSSQGSSSQNNIDTDALTAFRGKDTRGATRGVGPVSKSKLKAIAPIVSQLTRAKTREEKHDEDMAFLKSSVTMLLSAFESNGLKIPNPSPRNYTPVPHPSPRNYTPVPHSSPHDYTPVPHSSPHDYIPTPRQLSQTLEIQLSQTLEI